MSASSDDFHPLLVGDEAWRQIAAIELHAFDHVERRLHRARFFDSDDAVFADLVHGFGDDAADRLVVVRGDRPDCKAIMPPLTGLDWATSAATIASTAFSMPRFSSRGLAPAARFFRPSL
jgi:hypothetical protein